MALLGVKRIVLGVEDRVRWRDFFTDFGLALAEDGGEVSTFRLPEGSTVTLRNSSDPKLPPAFLDTDGPREIIWGVDCASALQEIETELSIDREVVRDADGTLHTIDPNGIRVGFEVYDRKLPDPIAGTENTINAVQRLNWRRRWFARAHPKVIQHVVIGVPDIDVGVDFYTRRLNFRVTDIARGVGVFMRCDGRSDHHNLFLPKAAKRYFHHISFGVDNIDELMAGANHMQRKGWPGGHGLGRHRISSMIFYYLKSPTAGEIEYSADGDVLDDNWQPSLWAPKFGNIHWLGQVTEPHLEPALHDITPLPNPIPPFSTLT